MGQSPYPSLKVAELTARGALGLAVKRKAHADQRATQEHQQQRICGHDIPNSTDQITKSVNILQNVGNSHSGSSLDFPLLP